MGVALEAARLEGTDPGSTGADWPRRIIGTILLIWLAPAIAVVLLVGAAGMGVGAAARLIQRLSGRTKIRQEAARTVEAPRGPHLGPVATGLRSARRR